MEQITSEPRRTAPPSPMPKDLFLARRLLAEPKGTGGRPDDRQSDFDRKLRAGWAIMAR